MPPASKLNLLASAPAPGSRLFPGQIMIKTVLFDLGNVILPFDVSRLATRLGEHSSLSPRQIVENLWNDHIAEHFETGRMSPEEYFDHVSSSCGFKELSFAEFVPLFNEIFDEDAGVIDLIATLKRNYSLGLISNTNPIHAAHLVSNFPSLSHFDRKWFSNEAGVRKPHRALFEMALEHFSSEPDEAVFIDDLAINVASAKEVGINAIQFHGIEPLKRDLRDLGVRT